MPTETPALALESTELSLSDYRTLREGREVPTIETPSAADAATADAETVAETESAETNLEESKQEEKPKQKSDKLNARFSELTAKIRTLETQLAAKPGAGQTEKPAAAVEAPPPADDPEPNADKFDSYVEWQKSWNRWDRRQENRAAEVARAAEAEKTAAQTKAQTWQAKVSEAAKEYSDFAEVAQNPELPVTRAMGEAILESELGTKILYHLGQNPDEAARIAALSTVAQVREIGKLEAKLETPAAAEETASEPLVKKLPVSKAPAPHKPISGAASANPAKNIEGMTQAEYRAYRESGKIR